MLLYPMVQRLEGVDEGFLRQMKKLNAKRLKDGFWRKVAAEKALQGAGTQLLQT